MNEGAKAIAADLAMVCQWQEMAGDGCLMSC